VCGNIIPGFPSGGFPVPDRIALLADIHGNSWALAAVLDDVHRHGVTRVVDLGDVLYGPLNPLATFQQLAAVQIPVTISGNMDRLVHASSAGEIEANPTLAFVLRDLGPEPVAWLKTLPGTATLDDEIFLCHGTPASDDEYLLEDVSSCRPFVFPEAEILRRLGRVNHRVILCAHSHIPRVVHLSTGQLIVNPGSVGLAAYDQNVPHMHYMESYAPHACYAILEKGAHGWNVSLHRVAYDWTAAARRASELGREDWARGIATGRMLR
jgi:predicted phosphodiesterase